MKLPVRSKRILVISPHPGLLQICRKAAESDPEWTVIDFAAAQSEGLRQLNEIRPDVIILGDIGPPGTLSNLYRDLQQGWISHHASLLLVEQNAAEAYRILSDENLATGIGGRALSEGIPSPLLTLDQVVPKLAETIARKLKARENRLRNAILDPDRFCLVWEQIPGPGAFEVRQELVLENARKAARSGRICAISITDNPGGNPAIATDILCAEIRKAGIEPLVHVAFRDRSRNQAESLLFQLAALDINNVLILTGDYPSNLGFTGKSKPVFDLDSVNGLRLVAQMNSGMEREIMRKPVRLAPTDFFAGVAFSPFKQMEAEVMGQYYKLKKKMEAGADFVITQVGYDARKLHELKLWLRSNGYEIPVLASIYILSHPVAKAMHQNNIPGCVVTDQLLSRIAAESESGDRGRQARLDRAAKMFAVVKGMGFRGAYVSGQGLPFESVEYIVAKGNELAENWTELVQEFDYPQRNGFYLYERNPETGLNTEKASPRTQQSQRPLIYLLSRAIHRLIFDAAGPLFKPTRRLMQRIHSSRFLYRIFHSFERCSKSSLYGCKDCGDCALFETAYLCPVSQCPKDQRNAPCGGSYEGWCEVYPGEKQCVWVRAYLRLKAQGREAEIGEHIVPPVNWELWQTSAWVNYFLGRDHNGKKAGSR